MLVRLCWLFRPGASFAAHQCTKRCQNPRLLHEKAAKWTGRHLLKTRDKGIVLRPEPMPRAQCHCRSGAPCRSSLSLCAFLQLPTTKLHDTLRSVNPAIACVFVRSTCTVRTPLCAHFASHACNGRRGSTGKPQCWLGGSRRLLVGRMPGLRCLAAQQQRGVGGAGSVGCWSRA